MLILPAGAVRFVKTGAFAWNGLMGLYVPLGAFVVWISAMTWAVHGGPDQADRGRQRAGLKGFASP